MQLKAKAVLVLVSVALLVSVVAHAIDDEAAWLEYKQKFGKTYKTAIEEQIRKKLFIDNKHYIESHNTKSKVSFKQAINFLSDLSTEEVNEVYNGFRIDEKTEQAHSGASQLLEALLQSLNSALGVQLVNAVNEQGNLTADDALPVNRAWYEDMLSPVALDWRRYGRVSRVKNQGSCGSCWAFAATGALEGLLASRNRSILLSEQNLVDCSRKYGNKGCQGGMVDSAFDYVRDEGIMSAREYKYTGKNEQCKFKKSRSVLKLRGSARLPRGNEAILRLAMSTSGPIPVSVDASSRSFHSYSSGVYNDQICKNKSSDMNHAMLLVGYGHDRASGLDYWVLKNSWGTKWGDQGYIKIARGQDNLCGVATYAVLPVA